MKQSFPSLAANIYATYTCVSSRRYPHHIPTRARNQRECEKNAKETLSSSESTRKLRL